MFLRGIPELSLKMKRPPKVKNAASAARNAAGAGTGAPDFYRIAKVAPLPPSTPFKPAIQETKVVAGEDAAPRYIIQPLTLDHNNHDELEEFSFTGWTAEEPEEEIISVPFADPFGEDLFGRKEGATAVERKAPGSTDELVSGKQGVDRGEAPEASSHSRRLSSRRTEPSSSSSEETVAARVVSSSSGGEAISSSGQKLSNADISYLEYQNRILQSMFAESSQMHTNATSTGGEILGGRFLNEKQHSLQQRRVT